MVIIPPLTLHVLENYSISNSLRIILNFKEKVLNELSSTQTDLFNFFKKINEDKNYCISFKEIYKNKVESYLEALISLQFKEDFGDDLLFKIRFTQLLILIYNNYINYQHSEIIYENPIVSKSISFIMHNIDKEFTIDDVANYINISNSSLSHIFKEVTGISIYKYILKKRMILAKKLIKENIKLLDVFHMCGYNDYSSFSRAFKKEYGITPTTFKQTIRI